MNDCVNATSQTGATSPLLLTIDVVGALSPLATISAQVAFYGTPTQGEVGGPLQATLDDCHFELVAFSWGVPLGGGGTTVSHLH